MRIAGGHKFNNQRFAGLDLHGNLFTGFQAVEEWQSRQDADVGMHLPKLIELQKYVGVEEIAQKIVVADRMTGFLFEGFFFLRKIHCRHARAGTALHRFSAA